MEQSIGERSDVPTCSASVPSTQSERGEAATTDVTATKEPNPGGACSGFLRKFLVSPCSAYFKQ